jgi:enterobactin synthetase component F
MTAGDMSSTAVWSPLSAAQRGLFFAQWLDPDNPCYTTAEVVEIDGPLDADLLGGALRLAYGEFELLRTRFRLSGAGPEQCVMPEPVAGLNVIACEDDEQAERWMAETLARPMKLSNGDVVRSALLRFSGHRAWWFHAAHHVVMDGYAAQQFIRRVATLYSGAAPAPAVPLSDIIADQPNDERMLAFWQARLDGMEGQSALAGCVAPPSRQSLRVRVTLPEAYQDRIVTGAKRLNTSWPELLLAAVGAYVGRMVGLERVRVGLPLMNRVLPGVGARVGAGTVCTEVNVLPLTAVAAGSISAAIAWVHGEQEALRNNPFVRQEDLTRALQRRLPGAQLFGPQVNIIPFDLGVTWVHPNGWAARGRIRNLAPGPVEDLTVTVRGAMGRGRPVVMELDGNPALYDRESLEQHCNRLVAFIDAFARADEETDLSDLDLLAEGERERVIDAFNATQVERHADTLARRFLDQVEKSPHAVALLYEGVPRRYAELHEAATAVAQALRACGVAAGDVVGVCLRRGFELYEAVYGIVLLGAVYLPLDPDLPEERIAGMREDAKAVFVISSVVELLASQARRGGGPSGGRLPDVAVDDPAYVLFTSGSTGRPKGVIINHRAIDNRLAWMQHHLRLQPGERVLHKTPISFDVSVWELFWPLQVGATVVIASPDAHRDPKAIADLVVTQKVQVLHFVPSMLRAFLGDRSSRERVRLAGVRAVVTSGEALTPDLVVASQKWFGVAPTNLYGPTEAAIDVTYWDCTVEDEDVPIGRPVWNTACYVLDERRRPVPVGVAGELWLGGVQLADGYAGRPDLTSERFVMDPFRPNGRMYRTGDLAAWRFDGALRYLGRRDDQIKIRGQRIELGEIEAAIATCPSVFGVVAGVVDGQLVVWYVCDGGEETSAMVRDAAARRLPPSFMPQHWIAVSSIPLGRSGKADRKALMTLMPPRTLQVGIGTGPRDLLEQRICAVFRDVLGLKNVSPSDDFFALGGDSLRVLGLISAIEAETGRELSLATAFANPTAERLCAVLAADNAESGMEEVLTLRAPTSTSSTPLILLPPAGGLGWCYVSLLRTLPPDLPVYTIQAPGIAQGRPEPVTDLATLARRQLQAIRGVVGLGSFHVGGWSLGGMAAHSVAALARREGQVVGAIVLLDAYPSEQWALQGQPTEQDALAALLRLGGVAEPVGILSRCAVIQKLRDAGSALSALPEKVLDGCIASVIEASRIVRTPSPEKLAGDMTVIVAGAPRAQNWLHVEGWQQHVTGCLDVVTLDVNHADLVRRPVSDIVAGLLADRIAASGV